MTVNVIFAFALQNDSSNQNFLQQWKQELLKYCFMITVHTLRKFCFTKGS
jgi:hypothetical protein